MHETFNIECSFDSCNFKDHSMTDIYADDLYSVSLMNLNEDNNQNLVKDSYRSSNEINRKKS